MEELELEDESWPALPVGIFVRPNLFASAQPSAQQFRELSEVGCCTVINLTPAGSKNALPNEAALVTGLGMEYLHFPVDFAHPADDDYFACEAALLERQDQKCLLHCALNRRGSSFIAIYRVRQFHWNSKAAWAGLRKVWEPDAVWQSFIERLMSQDTQFRP